MNKIKRLEVISDDWQGCTRCGISETRDGDEVCMGLGNEEADYLFVLSPPTAIDMVMGTPLAGSKEFEKFEELIGVAGIPLEDTYLINNMGCRPSLEIGETESEAAQVIDRKPLAKEYNACGARLEEVIYTVDPCVVVIMNEQAFSYLIPTANRGTHNTLAKAHGHLFRTKKIGDTPIDYPAMVVSPIEKILKNPSTAKHGPNQTTIKAVYRLQKIVNYLQGRD